MKTAIGFILFVAFISGLLFLGIRYEHKMSEEAYNEGICNMCGGDYHFSSATHLRNSGDRFYYTCNNCGHTIMTYHLMK